MFPFQNFSSIQFPIKLLHFEHSSCLNLLCAIIFDQLFIFIRRFFFKFLSRSYMEFTKVSNIISQSVTLTRIIGIKIVLKVT